MRRLATWLVPAIVLLAAAGAPAQAVSPPIDEDVADYLAFVSTMGATAHSCWDRNLRAPNMRGGIMLARTRGAATLYHGTIDGTWAGAGAFRAVSFFGTTPWYPTLHVLGRSYFDGGVRAENYQLAPHAMADPRLIEGRAEPGGLYLYAQDFFAEKFVPAWTNGTGDQAIADRMRAEVATGAKLNIAGMRTIAALWNDRASIALGGLIQRRAIEGGQDGGWLPLARAEIGRAAGAAALGGVQLAGSVWEQPPLTALRDRDLLYDEVVYFGAAGVQASRPLPDPAANPQALSTHLAAWMAECGAAAAPNAPLPYWLDYMTFWHWSNSVFEKRERAAAARELQALDLQELRYWNRDLLAKLGEELRRGQKKKVGRRIDRLVALALRSGGDSMTSADVAEIRVLAYDLLGRYCDARGLGGRNYDACYVGNRVDVSAALEMSRKAEGPLTPARALDPANGPFYRWLY